MTEMLEKMKQMRFDKMRLGQAAPDIVEIPSLEGMRVALVPLTESEYDECIQIAGGMSAPDNPAGYLLRDRRANAETLFHAIRNPQNLEERVFPSSLELQNTLEVMDINHLTDRYMEMTARSSPEIDGFTEQELEDVKKVLLEINWSGLSGRSWYALRRFLSYIGEPLPADRFGGLSSTSSSTTTKNGDESTGDV